MVLSPAGNVHKIGLSGAGSGAVPTLATMEVEVDAALQQEARSRADGSVVRLDAAVQAYLKAAATGIDLIQSHRKRAFGWRGRQTVQSEKTDDAFSELARLAQVISQCVNRSAEVLTNRFRECGEKALDAANPLSPRPYTSGGSIMRSPGVNREEESAFVEVRGQNELKIRSLRARLANENGNLTAEQRQRITLATLRECDANMAIARSRIAQRRAAIDKATARSSDNKQRISVSKSVADTEGSSASTGIVGNGDGEIGAGGGGGGDDGGGGIDHLVLVIHGVGTQENLEVTKIPSLRAGCSNILQSHFGNNSDLKFEFVGVEWRSVLHDLLGTDHLLSRAAPPGLATLRGFYRDAVGDVLAFMSHGMQLVVDTCTSDLNQVYEDFRHRNPRFKGTVSLFAHSLGSVIAYDILSHQAQYSGQYSDSKLWQPWLHGAAPTPQGSGGPLSPSPASAAAAGTTPSPSAGTCTGTESTSGTDGSGTDGSGTDATHSRAGVRVSTLHRNKSGDRDMHYGPLHFRVHCFFTSGSPLAAFLAARGDGLGDDFAPPSCDHFYNIFHPNDPVALRIEPMLRPLDTVLDPPMVLPSLDSIKKATDALAWMEKHSVKCTTAGIRKCVDATLKPSFVESINEYLGAINSHKCYWASPEVMLFFLTTILNAESDPSDNDEQRPIGGFAKGNAAAAATPK